MILAERRIEVRIGPPGSEGRLWHTPLHIESEIHLSTGKKPNQAEIKLYNLSRESISYIQQTGNVIIVSAGEGIASKFFRGDVTPKRVSTVEKDGDRITTIKAADSQRLWRESTVSLSYPPGISRDVVLGEVLAGLGASIGYVTSLPAKTYPNGYSFFGRARDALEDVLDGDATYSIQDGAVQILAIGEQVPGNALVISASTGLIGSPERTDKGIKFSFKLHQLLLPGRGAAIRSKWYQGDVRLTKVEHKISTTEHWQSDCVGVPI